MGLTTNPNDPDLNKIKDNGQQEAYLVLSDEERAKGYVRPLRYRYRHTGVRPKGPTRPLTAQEEIDHAGSGYVCFEPYTPPRGSIVGRYWTQQQLGSGCGSETTMAPTIAQTYARNPAFYGGTFCCHCGKHYPVSEFVWVDDGTQVGS